MQPSGSTLQSLTYAVVTTARDEAANLPRLAHALAAQTLQPVEWVIAENGSSDGTAEAAAELARRHPWVTTISVPSDGDAVRGAPIVRAFHAGLEALIHEADVVVNVDADVSFDRTYFADLVERFAADERLGIASGRAVELRNGRWQPRHVTGFTVWGASRAYRGECLRELLPLEERYNWDGIDAIKANARGWRTRTFTELEFRHHRREGERDRSRMAAAREAGCAAYFMGYRPSYLLIRALFLARRDPTSLAMVWGYATSAAVRAERLDDDAARAFIRREQRLRHLGLRAREALGYGHVPSN